MILYLLVVYNNRYAPSTRTVLPLHSPPCQPQLLHITMSIYIAVLKLQYQAESTVSSIPFPTPDLTRQPHFSSFIFSSSFRPSHPILGEKGQSFVSQSIFKSSFWAYFCDLLLSKFTLRTGFVTPSSSLTRHACHLQVPANPALQFHPIRFWSSTILLGWALCSQQANRHITHICDWLSPKQ
jgi:hypothetical protein